MIKPFVIAQSPHLIFGVGKFATLPALIHPFGNKVLLVTGAKSFIDSPLCQELLAKLEAGNHSVHHAVIPCEPTPEIIDRVVTESASFNADVVVAIGGGSALDAGKAISALLPLQESVKIYLEGIGVKTHPGVKVPFIAVPTTAGTGSEATKNAVISEVGVTGFKKSLRHNNFVPNIALVDPMLTVSCSPETTAASGMDAFTQLLESYVSTAASPVTDSLALEGLSLISRSLLKAYHNGNDVEARSDMALAAYLSGITLANAGLGLVHGFASSIGGYFDIAHGVICSSTMAASNSITVRKLRTDKSAPEALKKYAKVGAIFSSESDRRDMFYVDHLVSLISEYSSELRIPRLLEGGVTHADFDRIIAVTDNKYNPAVLDKAEIREVLERSL
jgi:alcohol dehydrogenase class IV